MVRVKQPKKMLIINILDILHKYTDENHRLSQRDIIDILNNEYNMIVDRKSIRRNLMDLIDFGYNIEYSESIRMVRNSKSGELEESTILTDFYLVRDFTDAEIRLLIDGLLFSKHIPYSQCRSLVNKLENLSNVHFRSRTKHIMTLPNSAPENKQLFYTIEVLDEAITSDKKVAFKYNEYRLDKKIYSRVDDKGNIREYIINPYQIVAANGRYYLICNYDKYKDVSHYRLDRISDIKLLASKRKPMKDVVGLENGLDLPKHMAEHIYMFTGESERVKFRAQAHIINEVMDWFGDTAEISSTSDDSFTVIVNVNIKAMLFWAMQFGPYVEVLEPLVLRDQINDKVVLMNEIYQK